MTDSAIAGMGTGAFCTGFRWIKAVAWATVVQDRNALRARQPGQVLPVGC